MNHYGSGSKKSLSSAILALAKNPLIIGAIIGVLLNFFNIHITGSIKQLFIYLSNAATPLSLMSVGAGLIISMHIKKATFDLLCNNTQAGCHATYHYLDN
ncbi:AEC family transporter [Photorhabdus temperata]|uniref:AEC family transporter n=1 Tax=Photorhabdus temperata TaxID=574560 RepID=UPI001FB1356B|nr:AEC family transporter [Photorhabdus temperata]